MSEAGEVEKKALNRNPQPGLMRRMNISQDTASGAYYQNKLPSSILQILKEQNSFDINLYGYAVNLFRERFL